MAESTSTNPLLASTASSESSPEIQLHPLVLLTISDCIARRTIRQQTGPIAGAILGQQNGREITMEVAFDSKMEAGSDGQVQFDSKWFDDRLEMYKEVYKSPQLELVGWWTIGASCGPEQRHRPCQLQLQRVYNLESGCLLLFHPELVAASSGAAGKLPVTIYETVWANENGSMEVDEEAQDQAVKYREVRYTVETGEAEMISVDFVARGGGNATAVDTSFAKVHNADNSRRNGKGRSRGEKSTSGVSDEVSYLTTEEDELLTSLTAKANAIKMLQSRLRLLQAYLRSLPPSYLSDPTIPLSPETSESVDQPMLRSISALLARLPILAPSDTDSFARESEQTASDAELITLLTSLTKAVQDAKELGRKWNMAEPRKKDRAGFGGMGLDGMDAEELGGTKNASLQELMSLAQ